MSEEIKDIIEAEKEYNASQIQVLEGLAVSYTHLTLPTT